MPDQEFLASFAVEIDESGVSRLQAILRENRELADSLSAAFDAATESMKTFSKELPSLFSFDGAVSGADAPSILGEAGAEGTKTLKLGLDTGEAREDLSDFIAEAKKPVPLSANTAKALSAARSAFESIKSIFSQPLTLHVHVEADMPDLTVPAADGSEPVAPVDADEPAVPMSTGGRFTRPTEVQVAEDGDAEYIIPVRKEDRAVPLLRQLLSELSPAAREQLTGARPATEFAGLSRADGLAAGNVGTANVTQNNQNVSAPVQIDVHASGVSAEEIGESVYNTAERYLLRTLKGVFQ